MKSLILISTLACGMCCWGQAGDNPRPAPTNLVGQAYPQIHSDLSVTFQVKAPDAQKVQVQLGKRFDMEKGADGVWRATVEVEPGVHHYRFLVDGQWRDDPECALRVPNPFGGQDAVRQVA